MFRRSVCLPSVSGVMSSVIFDRTPNRRMAEAHGVISVATLSDATDMFLERRGSRDLTSLLKMVKMEATWKTAAVPSLLSHYSDLGEEFVKIAPNCTLPIKNLEQV